MSSIGIIIIGDEILSGKRSDKHLARTISTLAARGLQLAWADYLGDNPARITATLERTLDSSDIVFSFGGIGATPDDHTRQCAAAALGAPLVLHPEAKRLIEERMLDMARDSGKSIDPAAPENRQRLKMGEFPQGAGIIPNTYNKIPGFSIANRGEGGAHYFVPGFPVMAGPMVEWVLDTHYSHFFHQVAWEEKAVIVYGAMEAVLTPMMEEIEAAFPLVKIFSLPSVGDARTRGYIELGVKGDPSQVEPAFATLLAELDQRHAEYRPA